MKMLFAMTFLALAASVSFADQVPVTGRHQDMTFTSYEVNAFAAQAYQRIISRQRKAGLIDTDPKLVARVRRIAARLIVQAERLKYACRQWHWEIHVSDSPEVSASSMAGGKLLIGSRFIRKYRLSDGELAMVLGHEIAHDVAEHVREQLSEVQLRYPRIPYSVETASQALGSNLGLYLSLTSLFKRQETEADHIGVYLMMQAGYPPSAAVSFYRKLVRLDGGDDSRSFFPTHASDTARLRQVAAFVEQLEVRRATSMDAALRISDR